MKQNGIMTPGISTILKIRFTTGDNVLEGLRLEAERASRCSGVRPITEVFLSCESIVHILYDEVEDVFRHIAVNLSPKTAGLFATVKEY